MSRRPSSTGSRHRPALGAAQEDPTVAAGQESVDGEPRPAVGENSQGSERQGAASSQRAQKSALGRHGTVGGGVVHGGEELEHRLVVRAALHRQRPLTHLGQQGAGIEYLGDMGGELEALESGEGEHTRSHLEGPFQSRRHVAAQVAEGEVGTQPCQLGPTAHRARGHRGARGQIVEGGTDEGVAGVAPLGHTRQDEPGWGLGGEVLGRMHGQVGSAVEDGQLDLFDECTLRSELRHRDIGEGVARGLDDDRFAPWRAGQP